VSRRQLLVIPRKKTAGTHRWHLAVAAGRATNSGSSLLESHEQLRRLRRRACRGPLTSASSRPRGSPGRPRCLPIAPRQPLQKARVWAFPGRAPSPAFSSAKAKHAPTGPGKLLRTACSTLTLGPPTAQRAAAAHPARRAGRVFALWLESVRALQSFHLKPDDPLFRLLAPTLFAKVKTFVNDSSPIEQAFVASVTQGPAADFARRASLVLHVPLGKIRSPPNDRTESILLAVPFRSLQSITIEWIGAGECEPSCLSAPPSRL
jgi:hypothetical protein